jgi:ribosomal protein L16/L10AE
MGKGKGKIKSRVFPVSKGQILFELFNIPLRRGLVALRAAGKKFPFKVRSIRQKDRYKAI